MRLLASRFVLMLVLVVSGASAETAAPLSLNLRSGPHTRDANPVRAPFQNEQGAVNGIGGQIGSLTLDPVGRRLAFKNVDGSIGYGALLNAIPAGRNAVEQGDASDLNVSANGAVRTLKYWLYGLPYEASTDVVQARSAPGYAGDDAPALNAALALYPVVALRAPTGAAALTLNLKSTVRMPLVNQRLFGLSGPQGVVFHRDSLHTGSTLIIGSPTDAGGGARAAVVEDIFFTQDGRLNWLAANPGNYKLPNRLTGGQSQIELHGSQGARLKVGGWGGQYFISVFGGAGTLIDTPFIYGGVWDADHPELQEAIAQIRFTNSPVHGHGTSGRVRDPIMYGAGYTEARTYTIGNKSFTSPRRNGPRYGILIESLEDGIFTGGFTGLYAECNIMISPKDASGLIQNIEIGSMNIDESNYGGVCTRRLNASFPLATTINIHDNTFNGQDIGRFGIDVNGDAGFFSAANFKEHHNTYRAHLGSSVRLTGVDGGQSDNNRLSGFNVSVNDTGAGGALDASSGRYIGGITRNHITTADTTGGGSNIDAESNNGQRAYTDNTTGRGNTYAGIRLPFEGTINGVKALNLAGGGIIFGGKAAQGSQLWTPVISTQSGALTSYNVASANYTMNLNSNWITAKAEISIPANGTGAGYLVMTLPVPAANNGAAVGAGRENATGGKMLQVFVPSRGSAAQIYNFDGSYPAANGSYLIVEVTYEAAP